MASAASLRNVSLGRYWPGTSLLHRLDPRTKMVGLGLVTVAIVLASGWWMTATLLAAVLASYALARLPREALGAVLRPVLPVLIVLGVFQLLFGYESVGTPGADVTLLTVGSRVLTVGRVVGVLVALARLLSLILLVGLMMATTSASALVAGLELLLRPLDRIGLPGHELALTGAIALRFMPILGEELEAVQRAQRARDITGGPERRWQLARNARRTAALIVPLFADALRRVDEMTTAMLARGYQGGRGRTYMKEMSLSQSDWVVMAICLGLLALAVAF